MASVTVDASLCSGCGLCASLCSDVFSMTDDNIARVEANECGSCDLNDIASQCPVEAIKVE